VGCTLSLDYGRRRIGVAISDPLGITAQPFDTWNGLTFDQIVETLHTLICRKKVDRIIIGLPLTLKGEKGKLAKEVEQFAMKLRRHFPVPIILWDERLTSVQAKRILHQSNEKPSRKKGKVDLIASVLLLQNYLAFQRGSLAEDSGDTI
jgi:putative Holliday junction resolvase